MSIGARIGAGFVVGMAIIAAIGASAYVSAQRLLEANRRVTHTHEVIEGLERVLSAIKDAETGQRGYVLTGEERYLEPYNAADGEIQRDIDALGALTRDNAAQQEGLRQVRKLADAKLAELRETIQLRRKSGLAAALPVVLTDRGKKIMDALRAAIAEMKTREQRLLDARNDAVNASANRTILTIVVWMPIALLALAVAAVILMRTVPFGGRAAPSGAQGEKWSRVAVRYASAVLVVVVAVLLRRLMDSFGPLPLFLTFYPAVLLVASIGGGGPGIVATILSALAADYWFIRPYGSFGIEAPNDGLALAIFTGTCLFLSVLAERLRRARWAEATSVAQEQQLEELSRLNEELSQQSEELSQQSEELAEQNEELQTQSEEIQLLNTELMHREDVLQKLLDAARLSSAEQTVMQDICAASKEMFGPAASAVLVLEPQDGRLAILAQAGLGSEGAKVESLPAENCFAELVVAENKAAALTDASLRPDLALIHLPGEELFRAILAAPMRSKGRAFGVVSVYSRQTQEWTAEQFRLADWLAAQCAHILETLRLQSQLRRLYAEQQTIFNSVPAMIWYKDAKNNFVRVNRAVALAVGKPVDAIEGKSAYELFPDQAEHYYQDDLEVINSGRPKLGILEEMGTANGEKRWVQTDKIPYRGEGGDIAGVLVFTVDVTERKRAEEERARLAAIVESSDDAILSKDLHGVIQTWNAGANRLFGYREEEVVGQPITMLLPPERIQEEEQILKRLLSGQRVERLETVRVTKDGKRLDVSVTVSPLRGQDGQIIGASKIIHDIGERKRAEEAVQRSEALLRAVTENSPDPIFLKDRQCRLQFANPATLRAIGKPAAEVLGKTDEEFYDNLEVGRAITETDRRIMESGNDEAVEETISRPDGSTRVFLSTKSPLRDAQGQVVGIVGVARDITDRKHVEESLKAAKNSAEQAKAAAEQANRAKDHFLAVLSHELRTPLTPVVMGLSMLQDRPDLHPAVRETLEMVRRNVELEARLIDDLLDVSRIARGKIELSRSAVELCTIIHRAVEVCKPDIEARRLNFGVDFGPAAPYWVEADVPRLQQVFWNLLKNAIKFTPHGGCVGIRCRPSGEHVVVEVNDSGIGIEPEALSRIFNAFEQAERSITQQFGGLGLGLAISRALVEMHGGQIEAYSEGRDKGATFRVRLPLAAPPGQRNVAAPAAPSTRVVRPLRILLVEDHGVTAKMMRMVLTAEGHAVEMAGDIATALELADRRAFDLLLSDLGLPDGSGYDLMRQLRQRGHKFLGIALSGYGQGEDIQRSREAGFSVHLTKPASRDAIVEAIAAVASEN